MGPVSQDGQPNTPEGHDAIWRSRLTPNTVDDHSMLANLPQDLPELMQSILVEEIVEQLLTQLKKRCSVKTKCKCNLHSLLGHRNHNIFVLLLN